MEPAAILAPVLLAVAPLPALANLELAQKSAGMAYHAVDKKVVGPAHQQVTSNGSAP